MICPICGKPTLIFEDVLMCHPPEVIYTKWYRCTVCKYETEREENKMVAV
jgi:rubredoxin